MIKKRWATQYFAFWGGLTPQDTPPSGSLGDPPTLRRSGPRASRLALRPVQVTPPLFGPFCALRVWQKISHFQFETGFPRVALNNLGIKSGATSFGRKKAC